MRREEYRNWRHLFKLDPDKLINDEHLDRICLSGTDAIMIGGSSGVTFENTVELLSRVRRYSLPCVMEISNMDSIVPGFDLYFIPVVLNSRQPDWIVGMHQQAVKTFGHRIPWEMIVPEGYCILNPDCEAARLTDSQTDLDQSDVSAYAKLGEQMFQMPVIYLEYSGSFGDMELVHEVAQHLNHARLFYGGGIVDVHTATEAAAAADTIIVGNIVYENLEAALQTVQVKTE
ncbi:heptaprenylglyceryl phosphate synthase [Marinicrinis sediminis]|uniref:Heptaprenylglyceryl phosphate synthase n=1 Tax=Marinicrinis sediminis TaxID=1652465 RepID=A0ABW5RBC6_9BACL